jgi:leader peptidase (prepilin peptidase)/N-methyltransferase
MDAATVTGGGFLFALGACVGSFANVCHYRMPRACMSVTKPRSACPGCGKAIAGYDNIPIVSFLLLRGKCRGCGMKISWRYPTIELLFGLMFIAIPAFAWGIDDAWTAILDPPRMGPLLVLVGAVSFLAIATLIDITTLKIPDELSIGLLIAVLAAWRRVPARDAGAADLSFGLPAPSTILSDGFRVGTGGATSLRAATLISALIGAAAGAGLIMAVTIAGNRLFQKRSMGFGDVKLMAGIGALVGAGSVVVVFFLACLIGAVIGIVMTRAVRNVAIPFGPFLAAGAVVDLVLRIRGDESLLWSAWEPILG